MHLLVDIQSLNYFIFKHGLKRFIHLDLISEIVYKKQIYSVHLSLTLYTNLAKIKNKMVEIFLSTLYMLLLNCNHSN